LDLIKLLLGPMLIDRWEMWKPAIEEARQAGEASVYPLFEGLVKKLRRAANEPSGAAGG
jgi:hypothetical protein